MSGHVSDNWERGSPYEQYIGRWSRRVAPLFLSWLAAGSSKRWVDVGCGTGALSAAILDNCKPETVTGIEPSEGFLKLARENLGDRATFFVGNAEAIPIEDAASDIVVSGLVLNFVPNLPTALREMARVVSIGGTVSAYVWDYADKMEVIKFFWDAAVALDPSAKDKHEGDRFPICNPVALRDAFEAEGFAQIDVTSVDVTADFDSFEEYWQPFLGGQGPAPSYSMSLSEDSRAQLKEALRMRLMTTREGRLSLNARAWAVRGMKKTDL